MRDRPLTLGLVALAAIVAVGISIRQNQSLARTRAELARIQEQTGPLPAMREELVRLRQLEVDQAELARLQQREEAAKAELPRLRGQAANALRAESEAARLRSALESRESQVSENSSRLTAPMGEFVQGNLEQTFRNRVTRMHERLNLSAPQTEAIQEILSRKARGLTEAMKGVFSGKIDREKIAEARAGIGNAEAEIRALLSPEQQTAYATFLEEEKLNQASMAANAELLQMQHTLGLKGDQLDSVFTALYDHSLQQGKVEASATETAEPADALQKVIDSKCQALDRLLTPSQSATYRQQQELQLKLVKKMLTQLAPTDERQ